MAEIEFIVSRTVTGLFPLTTEFTYSPSCWNRWLQLYPDDSSSSDRLYNIPGGSLYQSCQPSGAAAPRYSPGMCASGYYMTQVAEALDAAGGDAYSRRVWKADCCRSGFTLSTASGYCTSSFLGTSISAIRVPLVNSTTTIVRGSTTFTSLIPTRYSDVTTNTTFLTRGTMFDYGMVISWQYSDLSRFPRNYTVTLASNLKVPFTPTPTASFSQTANPSATTSIPAATSSNSNGVSPDSLGAGAKAGVGVGAAVGALLILAMAFLLCRGRKIKRNSHPPGFEEEEKASNSPELVSVLNPGARVSYQQQQPQQWR